MIAIGKCIVILIKYIIGKLLLRRVSIFRSHRRTHAALKITTELFHTAAVLLNDGLRDLVSHTEKRLKKLVTHSGI